MGVPKGVWGTVQGGGFGAHEVVVAGWNDLLFWPGRDGNVGNCGSVSRGFACGGEKGDWEAKMELETGAGAAKLFGIDPGAWPADAMAPPVKAESHDDC